MDKLAHEFAAAILTFLIGLMPAALGAAVSLAYETGLTWTRRFVQLSVGVIVSYFATRLASALFPMSPFVQQAAGFVVGMIAYKAVPRFRDSAVDVVADLPRSLRDMIPNLRRKDPK